MVHDGLGEHAWVDKTLAGPAQLVRRAESASAVPAGELEYLHGDHLGSLSAVTDAAGGVVQSLAHDPYGTRRSADWGSALPEEDVRSVASAQDGGRSRRGFTGHEALDRTGFVHMGGRLYDPRIGRFMSPDPVISEPASGQGWNLYSYVGNSPMSRTDPSGMCYAAGPQCPGAQGGGGFTPVSPVLAGQHFFWRYHLVITVRWGWAFFGGSLLFRNSDSHAVPVPRIDFLLTRWLDSFATDRAVSLGQEASPADGRMTSSLPSWLTFTPGEIVSIGVGFIPIVGTAQSVYEVVTGRDLITGEEVHRGMALIGVLPGGKLIRAAAEKAVREVSAGALRSRLRRDMIKEKGPPPADMKNPEGHHDLPVQFRDDFEEAGLNIDTSVYGRWVERSAHRRWHPKYNEEWRQFVRPKPGVELTRERILGKLDELLSSGNYPATLE